MSTETNKQFCILTWALVLLTPLALVAGIGWPWLKRMSVLESMITASEDQIARYRRVIATLPRLQAELEQARSREDVKAFYYEATAPQLAGALLQGDLKDMVDGAGAQLTSIQILPVKAEEQNTQIGVRANLRCTIEPLLDLLYEIERARPFLFVDRLSVRSRARSTARRVKRARNRRIRRRLPPQGQLTVRLDVSGYVLVGDR